MKMPDRISRLEAKIAALEVLLETLFVDQLASDRNPRAIVDCIIDDRYARDQKLHEEIGNHVTIDLITETTVSFLDRALKRAQERQLRRSKGGPSQCTRQ